MPQTETRARDASDNIQFDWGALERIVAYTAVTAATARQQGVLGQLDLATKEQHRRQHAHGRLEPPASSCILQLLTVVEELVRGKQPVTLVCTTLRMRQRCACQCQQMTEVLRVAKESFVELQYDFEHWGGEDERGEEQVEDTK